MAEATLRSAPDTVVITPDAPISAGQVIQLKDGRAAFAPNDISSGVAGIVRVTGSVILTKTAGVVILNGGDVFWDHSANAATYKAVDDRDFLCGVAISDQDSASTIVEVALNVEGVYLIDLARDAYRSVPIGTQALNGLGIRRNGGCLNFNISSTSEAQKLDALSVAGFATGANAIVEIVFAVPNDGAGTVVDVSLGVANGTDATNADTIGESVFVHLNANDVNIYLESDDGTTEVAATDSTIDYTEGSATAQLIHVWFDFRNPADVQIYINGALMLGATVFNINAAVGPWKLLAHIEKTIAADVYELDLHRQRVRIAEQ